MRWLDLTSFVLQYQSSLSFLQNKRKYVLPFQISPPFPYLLFYWALADPSTKMSPFSEIQCLCNWLFHFQPCVSSRSCFTLHMQVCLFCTQWSLPCMTRLRVISSFFVLSCISIVALITSNVINTLLTGAFVPFVFLIMLINPMLGKILSFQLIHVRLQVLPSSHTLGLNETGK